MLRNMCYTMDVGQNKTKSSKQTGETIMKHLRLESKLKVAVEKLRKVMNELEKSNNPQTKAMYVELASRVAAYEAVIYAINGDWVMLNMDVSL